MFPNDLNIADHVKDMVRYHGFANTSSQNGEPHAEESADAQELALSRRFMLPSAHFEGFDARMKFTELNRTPGQPWSTKPLM